MRAYATNSVGTGYGNEVSFTTSTANPTVTTKEVSLITPDSAATGGDVTSDGGADITARGVCWSTSANPTTSDDKTSDGTGTGEFTSSLTDLDPRATYHVRAYATNNNDKTGYGEDRPFITSAPPSVFYVNKNDNACGNNSPCYSTIQAALNAASGGDIVKVSQGTYTEAPARNTAGTVSISGGWNDDYSNQTGTTEMYAPSASGNAGVKVLPKVQVVPH